MALPHVAQKEEKRDMERERTECLFETEGSDWPVQIEKREKEKKKWENEQDRATCQKSLSF